MRLSFLGGFTGSIRRANSSIAGTASVLILATALPACISNAGSAEELASEGIVEARQGRIGPALQLFDHALTVDPNNLKALYNGGLAHLFLRRGAEAVQRFEPFVQLRPNDALGHFNLSRAYALDNRKENALVSLRRAVELGFDQHQELIGGGFELIEDDLRFAQIEVLVAQRAGIDFDASRRMGSGAYGGQELRSTRLPGQRINVQCKGPKVPPAVAGNLVDLEADGCSPD